jgi:hypothetical protein
MKITIEEINEINTQMNHKKPAQVIIVPIGSKGDKGDKGDRGDLNPQTDIDGGYF